MKIYLAGTPGIEEREELAKDYSGKIIVILGYSAESVRSSFCF
jgi:hypothetical protein